MYNISQIQTVFCTPPELVIEYVHNVISTGHVKGEHFTREIHVHGRQHEVGV